MTKNIQAPLKTGEDDLLSSPYEDPQLMFQLRQEADFGWNMVKDAPALQNVMAGPGTRVAEINGATFYYNARGELTRAVVPVQEGEVCYNFNDPIFNTPVKRLPVRITLTDKNGNMKRVIENSYTDEGEISTRRDTFYNEKEEPVKRVAFGFGPVCETQWEYDPLGKVCSIMSFVEGRPPEKEIYVNGKKDALIKYDEYGTPKSKTLFGYNDHNGLLSPLPIEIMTIKYDNKYDENGNLVESEMVFDDQGFQPPGNIKKAKPSPAPAVFNNDVPKPKLTKTLDKAQKTDKGGNSVGRLQGTKKENSAGR